jgi:uncharacterized protein
MDLTVLQENLLNPPILFFALGLIAGFVKSDLSIPEAVTKLLSLYLLWAIGFKGGVQLRVGGSEQIGISLALAAVLATVIPIYTYFLLRRRLTADNAAALAAVYGSVSAVTFLTACSLLDRLGVKFGGHMVAALALMESPAIVMGVLFARMAWQKRARNAAPGMYDLESSGRGLDRIVPGLGHSLREAAFNGPMVLLTGSLAIGYATGEKGYLAVAPLAKDLFAGVLSFFLLELGLVASRRARDLFRAGPFLIAFGIIGPLVNAALATALARFFNLTPGNAYLLIVLAASASYIAAPAALRIAVPRARPGLYIPLALAVTFPFNIAVGLPLYWTVVQRLWHP